LSGKPIPEDCFLNYCETFGTREGKKIWRSKDRKRLYTWDSLHGEVEVFNKRGRHLGVLNPDGEFIKPAVKGRKIDV